MEKDVDKANILNAFFVRQASQSALDGEPPPIDAAPITEDSQLLVSFTISLSDVERALRALNARKAPGFDRIPTRLLVILKDEIVHCVHHIFTLSLTSGTLPTHWKSATVTPICKERGNRQVATNYRPISLLSVLSKCLEKLVFKTLSPTWTSSCQSISLDSARETPPHTSSLDWCTGLPLQATKLTPPLPASTTYQKPSTGYDRKVFSPNCTTLEFVVMPLLG